MALQLPDSGVLDHPGVAEVLQRSSKVPQCKLCLGARAGRCSLQIPAHGRGLQLRSFYLQCVVGRLRCILTMKGNKPFSRGRALYLLLILLAYLLTGVILAGGGDEEEIEVSILLPR